MLHTERLALRGPHIDDCILQKADLVNLGHISSVSFIFSCESNSENGMAWSLSE